MRVVLQHGYACRDEVEKTSLRATGLVRELTKLIFASGAHYGVGRKGGSESFIGKLNLLMKVGFNYAWSHDRYGAQIGRNPWVSNDE
jgi:hypothetical protein